jgi:hypothetical protein
MGEVDGAVDGLTDGAGEGCMLYAVQPTVFTKTENGLLNPLPIATGVPVPPGITLIALFP